MQVQEDTELSWKGQPASKSEEYLETRCHRNEWTQEGGSRPQCHWNGEAPLIHKDVSSVDFELTRAWWGAGTARWRVRAWLLYGRQVLKPVRMTIEEVWRQDGGEGLDDEIDLRGQLREHFTSRRMHKAVLKTHEFLKDVRKRPGKNLGKHFGHTGRVCLPRTQGRRPPLGHEKSARC